MDGRGRWMDNVFIERLWRSLKHECAYIHAFETGSALRAGLTRWIAFYNAVRPHTALDGRTPDEAYYGPEILALPALAPARLNNKLAAYMHPGNSFNKPPNCPINRDQLSSNSARCNLMDLADTHPILERYIYTQNPAAAV